MAERVEPRAVVSAWRAIACGLGAGALTIAITAPFLGRYGWERDEMYFVSAGHRPAFGYIDFPPVTAWVAWVINAVAGSTLVGLRLTGLACALFSTILVALMTRELGGGRIAVVAAAVIWAVTPYLLASASIFHTSWFDLLAWVGFLYLALRILSRPEPRLWPVLGLVAGVGLQTKYTIVALLAAFATGLLVTEQRRVLATRGPWLAAAAALAVFAPNVVWQARHGWPSVHFFSSQHAFTAGTTSRPGYVVQQVLFMGAASALAAIGIFELWRRPAVRPLAVVPVFVTFFYLFEEGQGYYPLPADAIAVAGGAVALTRAKLAPRALTATAVGLVALQVVAVTIFVPHIVPVRSTASMVQTGTWKVSGWRPSFFAEEIGWEELARQTERVWLKLPDAKRRSGAIVAANYGEASALEVHWPADRRPLVVSGYLSWQYWRPSVLDQRFALVLGYEASDLDRACSSWRVRGRVSNRWKLPNGEYGRLIASCNLRVPLGQLWNTLTRSRL